jgi:hypothetical protein
MVAQISQINPRKGRDAMTLYKISCPFCGAGMTISDDERHKCHSCKALISFDCITVGFRTEYYIKANLKSHGLYPEVVGEVTE